MKDADGKSDEIKERPHKSNIVNNWGGSLGSFGNK